MGKKKCVVKYIVIALVLLLAYTFVEPHLITKKSIDIISPEIPIHFHNTRIVFVSDIHYGPFFSLKRVKKVLGKINSLNPDIVLLGGDYVHRDSKYIEPCFKELEELRATLGVYGVLGNHDHWEDPKLTRQCMAGAGILTIGNRSYWIEKGEEKIKVGGVGDYYQDTQDLEPTISDVTNGDFVILVTHNPDYVEKR